MFCIQVFIGKVIYFIHNFALKIRLYNQNMSNWNWYWLTAHDLGADPGFFRGGGGGLKVACFFTLWNWILTKIKQMLSKYVTISLVFSFHLSTMFHYLIFLINKGGQAPTPPPPSPKLRSTNAWTENTALKSFLFRRKSVLYCQRFQQ